MTSPDEPGTIPRNAHSGILAASVAARRAAIDLARREGTPVTERPAFPGSEIVGSDLRPLDGVRAARRIEVGARYQAREYIREAREDGATWDEIGRALGLSSGAGTSHAGTTVAEAAYTYTAGSPDTDLARRYGRSFGWVCCTCQQVIDDRGVQTGPADDEHGHAGTCRRLAQTVATWQKQWEAGQ